MGEERHWALGIGDWWGEKANAEVRRRAEGAERRFWVISKRI
jgi:hypothetical protein